MDTDISDILASVSGPAIPQQTLNLQALTRAWINERTAPDLLPYPDTLIEQCTQAVKRQIDVIEDMAGSMDPAVNFTLVILQTELERMKFLIRSFLRARIAKIDKYPIHYRDQSASAASNGQTLLSSLESQYLASHQSLLSAHYHACFLDKFQGQLQKLDDTTGGISMVDRPDLDTSVFCRVLRDAYVRRLIDDDLELKRGDIWLLRWNDVRDTVRTGAVELV